MASKDETSPQPVPIEIEPISPDEALEPTPVKTEDVKPAEDRDEPLSLVETGEEDGMSKIHARSAGSPLDGDKYDYARQLNVNGTGATRCRVFHCRIAEAPIERMQGIINEWLDSEQIEVKQVGHLIGTLEGKNPGPNLIAMVWY